MIKEINVKDIVKKDKISKLSNGVNIFNIMISEYKKNNDIKQFNLNMEGMKQVSAHVFKEIVHQMQIRLEGQFGLEIHNANTLITQQFKLALR